MPPSSILLKIKGSAGLKQTASLETEDELRKAWRVCTRVKDGLENGLRLENLSWRLWHLHNKLLRSQHSSSGQAQQHLQQISQRATERMELNQNDSSDVAIRKHRDYLRERDELPMSVAQKRMQRELQEQVITLNDLFGCQNATAVLGNLEDGPRLELPSVFADDDDDSLPAWFDTEQAVEFTHGLNFVGGQYELPLEIPQQALQFDYSTAPEAFSRPLLSTIYAQQYGESKLQEIHTMYPSRKRAKKAPSLKHKDSVCAHCECTATPLWRKVPETGETLCNACGLYWRMHKKPRPQELKLLALPPPPPQCFNCRTLTTPLWRRDDENSGGVLLCNACGLYKLKHKRMKPISVDDTSLFAYQQPAASTTTNVPFYGADATYETTLNFQVEDDDEHQQLYDSMLTSDCQP